MNSKQKFRDMGYGMFIHYGLYSIYGQGEWYWDKNRMTREEYYSVLPEFKPEPGCQRKWVEFAVRNGMRYMVLTTRHHDGFWLGDSFIREYCDVCREYGLGTGVYFSVMDWSDDNFLAGPAKPEWEKFVRKTHDDLKHLMTNFGKIDYLFYDGCPPPVAWEAKELHKELRRLQPELLISCRCGMDEDVYSCEQNMANSHPGALWESCYTLNHSWGWNENDNYWKTPAEVARMLLTLRHNGGNLLLNIGPRSDGSIPEKTQEILEEVGSWLKYAGEAVYGVAPHPFNYIDREISTGKGKNAYVMCADDVRNFDLHAICGIANKVQKITLLGKSKSYRFSQDDRGRLFIHGLGKHPHNVMPRILKLELDSLPKSTPRWPTIPNLKVRIT